MTKLSKANAEKLATVVSMTTNSEQGFAYMTEKSVKALLDADYVECNNSMTDGDKVAVRATKTGLDAFNEANAQPEEEGTETMDTPATNAPATAAPAFAIETGVAIPAIKRSGSATSVYPFDALAIGQSFFVPATEAMPNPGKSLASTVSSASKRYATENGTREINRKVDGVMTKATVPAYDYERKFMVRSVEENGVKGARVWRVEVDTADDEDGNE